MRVLNNLERWIYLKANKRAPRWWELYGSIAWSWFLVGVMFGLSLLLIALEEFLLGGIVLIVIILLSWWAISEDRKRGTYKAIGKAGEEYWCNRCRSYGREVGITEK